ncbi:MAG: hypothetical protein RSG77_21860 [Hafnia sp.]
MNNKNTPITLEYPEAVANTRVCGAEGKPLLVYHGTRSIFTIFELSDKPLARGNLRGFYFTSNLEAAMEYGPHIMMAYIDLKNPFIGNAFDHFTQVHGITKPGFGSSPEVFEKYKAVTPTAVKAFLIAEGYDGVIVPANTGYMDHDEIVAFESNQIHLISPAPQVEKAVKPTRKASIPSFGM